MRYNADNSEAILIVLNKSYCEINFNIVNEFGKYKNYEVIKANLTENELILSAMDYSVVKVKF